MTITPNLRDSVPLSARVVSVQSLSAGELELWDSLQAAYPDLANAFLSHPYVTAASTIFPGVRVCVIERRGRPIGYFPFQYRRPWHRLLGWGERIGGELSDYFGVVAPPDIGLTPARLLSLAGLTTLPFTHLPKDSQGLRGLFGERPEPGLRISFPAGGATYWAQLRQRDKRFVADTERRERKLAEAKGELRFVHRHEDPLPRLQHLVAAKRAQYGRTGVGDPLADPKAVRLLETLACTVHPSCQGILSTLMAGDHWVASHFGLMHGKTLHYWFPVYNPEFQSFSPGRLLLKAIIHSSDKAGITLIDRGAGDTPAKRDFANVEHQFTRGLWSTPSARALVGRVGLAVKWRLDNGCRAAIGASGGVDPASSPSP